MSVWADLQDWEYSQESKQGTGDVICVNVGWKALKHANVGGIWGFIPLNSWLWLHSCIYNIAKSVASGDVVKAVFINYSSAQENREEWR